MVTITGVFLKLPLYCHWDCYPQMPRYLETHGCGYVFSIIPSGCWASGLYKQLSVTSLERFKSNYWLELQLPPVLTCPENLPPDWPHSCIHVQLAWTETGSSYEKSNQRNRERGDPRWKPPVFHLIPGLQTWTRETFSTGSTAAFSLPLSRAGLGALCLRVLLIKK